MNSLSTCFCLFLIAFFVVGIQCRGRLFEPPSRASMWRRYNDSFLNYYQNCIEPDPNDDQLNCGGKSLHQVVNGGRCGVCGDPFNAVIKEHEAGGRFAKGIITRQYDVGQPIRVEVDITDPHKGYFEFRLCPSNEPRVQASQECLSHYLLTFSNGDTKWYLPEINPKGRHQMYVYPPLGIVCSQCLLQWRYRTGNSWGCEAGNCSYGLGPQEEFYGCADIAIGTSKRQPTTCAFDSLNQGNLCKDESKNLKAFCLSCTRYYVCAHNRTAYFDCPIGTVCSNVKRICEFSHHAKNPLC